MTCRATNRDRSRVVQSELVEIRTLVEPLTRSDERGIGDRIAGCAALHCHTPNCVEILAVAVEPATFMRR